MKKIFTKQHRQFLFVDVTDFVFIFAAQSLTPAQGTPRKYKAGDTIDVSNDTILEVVECRFKLNNGEEECDVIPFRNGSAGGMYPYPIAQLRRYNTSSRKAEGRKQKSEIRLT